MLFFSPLPMKKINLPHFSHLEKYSISIQMKEQSVNFPKLSYCHPRKKEKKKTLLHCSQHAMNAKHKKFKSLSLVGACHHSFIK